MTTRNKEAAKLKGSSTGRNTKYYLLENNCTYSNAFPPPVQNCTTGKQFHMNNKKCKKSEHTFSFEQQMQPHVCYFGTEAILYERTGVPGYHMEIHMKARYIACNRQDT